jgi:hypothetical protein
VQAVMLEAGEGLRGKQEVDRDAVRHRVGHAGDATIPACGDAAREPPTNADPTGRS